METTQMTARAHATLCNTFSIFCHLLRGSGSTVLTATSHLWEPRFLTPTNSSLLSDRRKIVYMITSVTSTTMPNLVQSRPRVASGQMR